jgi:hypothetical protein
MMFECSVSVDAFDPINNKLSIECNNSSLPADVLEKLSPSLRTLQVTTGGVYSGVVLQLGMKLGIGILQETFDIEDMSGRESCWLLVPFDASSTPPEDTGVLMPNGTAVFTYNEPTSVDTNGTIPFKSNINLLIDGSNIPVPVQAFGSPYSVTTEHDNVVQEYADLDSARIKSLKLAITLDIATTGDVVDITLPVVSCDFSNKTVECYSKVTTYGNPYGISCVIRYDSTTSEYVLDFNISKLVANSATTTFNITKVGILF